MYYEVEDVRFGVRLYKKSARPNNHARKMLWAVGNGIN